MASINPFFEFVATYRRKHRDLKQQRVIVSRAAVAWQGLSASQKSRYRKRAIVERLRRLKIANKKSQKKPITTVKKTMHPVAPKE